jgi:hypothetical protein
VNPSASARLTAFQDSVLVATAMPKSMRFSSVRLRDGEKPAVARGASLRCDDK